MSESSSERYDLLSKKLDEIEGELRRIGYWSQKQIDPFKHLSEGEAPSYLNASSFEAWLQFVFLPNARQAVEKRALPRSSQVGLMAKRQYDYHSHVPEAQDLVRLLHEFDSMINSR